MPLRLVTFALYLAAAGSALLLARRDHLHRPIAAYLCAIIAIDLIRWGRSLVLPPATGPREGWELVARHAEQGLYLAAILALAAMAWAVFRIDLQEVSRHHVSSSTRATRIAARLQGVPASDSGHLHDGAISIVSQIRRWFFDSPVPAAWLLLWAYLIADYPALSGAELLRAYHLVEVGAVLFSGLCFARWLSAPRLPREGLSPAVACTLALISGPAATVVAPYLTRGTTLEAWPGIVAANGVAVSITLVLQIGALTRRRAKCSCYPS